MGAGGGSRRTIDSFPKVASCLTVGGMEVSASRRRRYFQPSSSSASAKPGQFACVGELPPLFLTAETCHGESKILDQCRNFMRLYTYNDDDLTIFAETDFRNHKKRFGIKRRDRRHHLYVVGKTGMGKSTLLENLISADLQSGEGLALFDPHGDLLQRVSALIPPHRLHDVVFFTLANPEQPLAFNVLQSAANQRHLVASGLISVFKKIWADSWGPRTEHILRHALLALLELPGSTLLDFPALLTDERFRQAVVALVGDDQVRHFWLNEFGGFSKNFRAEALSPIQNKIGQFLANPLIRSVVGQKVSSFNLRQIIDDGKVLLIDLAKGRIGEDVSSLLGALLLTHLEVAALSRADIAEAERRDFYVYLDEFYNFTSAGFASLLSEARKFHLNLILAHQYVEQVPEALRAAILGNVGSLIAFRLGAEDARLLAGEFYPVISPSDLSNLPAYRIYLKLMIDGVTQPPFSARTLPPRS